MNRKGVALALVLMIILVVVILSNVTLSIMNSQNRFTHHQVSRLQAYYACQAAMNLAFERMRKDGNFASFSLCTNPGACAAPNGGNAIYDGEIPFRVDVTIDGVGTSIGNGAATGRRVTIFTDYRYTPP